MNSDEMIRMLTALQDSYGVQNVGFFGVTPYAAKAIADEYQKIVPQLPAGAFKFDKASLKSWPVAGKHVLAIVEMEPAYKPVTPFKFFHAYMTPGAEWVDVGDAMRISDVVAWMPLPGESP
jgi:hypothetical protein